MASEDACMTHCADSSLWEDTAVIAQDAVLSWLGNFRQVSSAQVESAIGNCLHAGMQVEGVCEQQCYIVSTCLKNGPSVRRVSLMWLLGEAQCCLISYYLTCLQVGPKRRRLQEDNDILGPVQQQEVQEATLVQRLNEYVERIDTDMVIPTCHLH